MANIYGVNYTKEFLTFPKEHGRGFEFNGKLRVLCDELSVAGAIGDVMTLGRIPKGARILECKSINAGAATFNVTPGSILAVDTDVTMTLAAAGVSVGYIYFIQD